MVMSRVLSLFNISLFLFIFSLQHRPISTSSNLLKKSGCTVEELNRIDMATARLLTAGPNGRKVPETFEQLKPFCAETKNLTTQVESFIEKCYNREINQYSKIAMYTAKKNIKLFCGSGASKKSKKLEQMLFKANPCINKHSDKNWVCMERLIAEIRAANGAEDKLKIPHLCCSSLKSVQCIEDELDRVECGRANRELIMDFIRSNTDDFFNVGCAEYTDSNDKCQTLTPLNLNATQISKKTKRLSNNKQANQRVYATPVFAMIDLMTSIGNANSRNKRT